MQTMWTHANLAVFVNNAERRFNTQAGVRKTNTVRRPKRPERLLNKRLNNLQHCLAAHVLALERHFGS